MSDEKHTSAPAPVASAPVVAGQSTTITLINSLGIPVAIVIAGALVAGAMYLGNKNTTNPVALGQGAAGTAQPAAQNAKVPAVTDKDMIRGNPKAPIKIVTYSDYDCPFCKIFDDTMNKIMKDYGDSGKVAWVYRQLPLQQLHPNAPKISIAAMCVTDLGGNEAFWKFTDAVFASRKYVTNANGQQNISFVDVTKLHDFAVGAGVDGAKFDSCASSGKFDAQLANDIQAAMSVGAQGTPYSVIMSGNDQGVINGAQPYEVVKSTIDGVLAKTGTK